MSADTRSVGCSPMGPTDYRGVISRDGLKPLVARKWVRTHTTEYRSKEGSELGIGERGACSLDVAVRIPTSGGTDVVGKRVRPWLSALGRNEHREKCRRRRESYIGQRDVSRQRAMDQ